VLQSNDFPPLTSLTSVPEKKTPVIAGAWTNPSSMRSILMPSPGHANTQGNALVLHSLAANSPNLNNVRLEEQPGFERPPPKPAAELFNPKRRPHSTNGKALSQSPERVENDRERPRIDTGIASPLLGKVVSLSLEDGKGAKEPAMALSMAT
jgi:hypothetical protein